MLRNFTKNKSLETKDKRRFEFKLVALEHEYPWVCCLLRLLPEGLRTLYPPRRVQSIYFDTAGGAAFEDNLAGISRRSKVRFRWYGPATKDPVGQLEVKHKHDQLGWKEIFKLNQPLDLSQSRKQLVSQLAAQCPGIRPNLLDGLEPVQWIAYEREYWTTACGNLRLTLDRNLAAWDQRLQTTVAPLLAMPLTPLLILEVKCDQHYGALAKKLIARLPLQVDKCSKFVMATLPGEAPRPNIVSPI